MIYYTRTDPDGRPPKAEPITAALILVAVVLVALAGGAGAYDGYRRGSAREAELAELLDRCASVSERSRTLVWDRGRAALDTLDMLGGSDPEPSADVLAVADQGG